MEDQTVGVSEVLLRLVVDAAILTDLCVHAVKGNGVVASDNIRGDVLEKGASGLNKRALAHTGADMLDDGRGEDGAIVDLAVTGHLGAVAEDTLVANLRIVGDVGTLHEEVVVANDGLTIGMGGTVDDDILAEDVVVANLQNALLAAEVEVLRQCSDDGTLMDFIAAAHAGAAQNADEGEDDATVANFHIVLDVNEWEYLAALTYLGLGADFCSWTDFAHNFQKVEIFNLSSLIFNL